MLNLKYKKIGLLGFHGYGNLGDAAIQEAILKNIRLRLPGAEIAGFSLNPEDTVRRHGIVAFPIARRRVQGKVEQDFSPSHREEPFLGASIESAKRILNKKPRFQKLIQKLRRIRYVVGNVREEVRSFKENVRLLEDFDLLIVAGGGAIDDDWGGPWEHPYALLKWAVLAKASKTRFIVLSVGASMLKSKVSRRFIKTALSLADYRSYRDSISMEFCSGLIGKKNEPVFPDLAFGYPLKSNTPRSFEEGSRVVVGIFPMAYCYPEGGGWPRKERAIYEEYIRKMSEFSKWLVMNGYSIRFFSSQVRNDPVAINDILDKLGGNVFVHRGDRVTGQPESEVDSLISEIASVDIVIASRLHGVILSYLLQKPVVAISYHPKVEAVTRDFDQDRFLLDIERFSVQELIHRFQGLERNIAAVKSLVGERLAQYQGALEKQYDQLFGKPAAT